MENCVSCLDRLLPIAGQVTALTRAALIDGSGKPAIAEATRITYEVKSLPNLAGISRHGFRAPGASLGAIAPARGDRPRASRPVWLRPVRMPDSR